MRRWLALLLVLAGFQAVAQEGPGILLGSTLDEKSKPLAGTSVELISLADSNQRKSVRTEADGSFRIGNIAFGYYRLRCSYVGFQTLVLDSIYFRAERSDFNLNDIILKPVTGNPLDMVMIYAEKPLIESKEGNITFNAGESALSAGSNTSELLATVPLVTKDPSGKLLVRGREPKILIDDKPVELNQQQLQDLLESMPGSAVEKIEVLTNPPPQYANEQGGVINIVTRKGTVGMNGRVSVYQGTRGDGGTNASFNYRRQGLTLNLNGGAGYNRFDGSGYSRRENRYADSTNYLNTDSWNANKNFRPNFRGNLNYDLNKFNALNLVLQFNGNQSHNTSETEYSNINNSKVLYALSRRTIRSEGDSYTPNVNLSYTHKTKRPGEVLRVYNDLSFTHGTSDRDFYQEFLHPDGSPLGKDSTQQQLNDTRSLGHSLRLTYDRPLPNQKTYLSVGSFHTLSRSDVDVDASYRRKSDSLWLPLDALSNDFRYGQRILNFRGSVKQVFKRDFSVSAGLNAERTTIRFDLHREHRDTSNSYWSFLPFATFNRNWREVLNLTLSYRRTIRRPGINELNPTVDISDPYNVRFGNPGLQPSLAHNFDLVLGKTKRSFYANLGLGYNVVQDIFAQVRDPLPAGKTQITWQNISGRKEYEASTWSGYTLSRQVRVNLSASYTYNTYSDFDKKVKKYRNGGSLTSSLNGNYNWKDLYTATGSFTFNRFANPQGSVKSSLSMNIGLQARLWKKKCTVTLNLIDPFLQQQSRTFTYGTNFNLESYSSTQTRNYRLSLAYNFSKKPPKKGLKLPPAKAATRK